MKWTTHQLVRFINESMDFKETVDYSEIAKTADDIIRISPTTVNGNMRLRGDKFVFELEIDTVLTMECAITLKEVEVPLHIEVEEIYSDSEEDNQIEGITIDLDDVIWLNVLAAKPMRVVSEGAKIPESEVYHEPEETETINPAFSDLKKYL